MFKINIFMFNNKDNDKKNIKNFLTVLSVMFDSLEEISSPINNATIFPISLDFFYDFISCESHAICYIFFQFILLRNRIKNFISSILRCLFKCIQVKLNELKMIEWISFNQIKNSWKDKFEKLNIVLILSEGESFVNLFWLPKCAHFLSLVRVESFSTSYNLQFENFEAYLKCCWCCQVFKTLSSTSHRQVSEILR